MKIHFVSPIARCESQEIKSCSIAQADSMYERQSATKQYNYVVSQKFNNSENPEILWRYGRACFCFYDYSSASKEEKAAAIIDGLRAAQKAVLLDPENAYAFVVSSVDINAVRCSLNFQWLGRLTGCVAELCAYTSPLKSCRETIKCREHFKVKLEVV